MTDLIRYALSGLWQFVGFFIIMTTAFRFLFLAWDRLIRHLNIRAAGWPPAHLDADGDFVDEDDDDENE